MIILEKKMSKFKTEHNPFYRCWKINNWRTYNVSISQYRISIEYKLLQIQSKGEESCIKFHKIKIIK